MNYWDIHFRQVIYNGIKFKKWHYWGFRSDSGFISPDRDQIQESHYQYTGQDIDGVMVFEGDIIETRHRNSHTGKSWKEKGFVVFKHGGFKIQLLDKDNREFGYYSIDLLVKKARIIGNVVETPELVEAG